MTLHIAWLIADLLLFECEGEEKGMNLLIRDTKEGQKWGEDDREVQCDA